MESHLSDESLWASGLAARLRLIQANFADDEPATRQGYVTEEIERALKDIVPAKRKAYLEALADRFPAWQSTVLKATVSDKPLPPETPEAVLSLLIEMTAKLPPERKAEFARKLHEAGLVHVQQASALEMSEELRRKLGIPAGAPLNAERVGKLIGGLSEWVLALDQLAWALWKQIHPRSPYRKEADFSRLAGVYLAGDPEVSTQQVAQPLEKTRKLIAGLLGAIGRAGSVYGKKHVARFAPEVLEDWARLEKKFHESLESVAWRKYKEHAKEHATEHAIENELQEAIAKTAEVIMTGRAGS